MSAPTKTVIARNGCLMPEPGSRQSPPARVKNNDAPNRAKRLFRFIANKAATSALWIKARGQIGIEPLRLFPDHVFHFPSPFGVEPGLVRCQLMQQAQEFAGVNQFFVGDFLDTPCIRPD